MNQYRKLIAYVIGAACLVANRAWGFEFDQDVQAAMIDGVIALLTGLGIWGAFNESVRRSSSPTKK